jgi:peptidoglycan/LPS O-acetylase OafA/YrhL
LRLPFSSVKIIQGKLDVESKLQGLQVGRAVAAMTIVYFHSWVAITRFPKDTAYQIPGLTSYGHLAVDLFFAISGFVICLVVSRDTFNVQSFFIKRLFRLYPLWLLMLTSDYSMALERTAAAREPRIFPVFRLVATYTRAAIL